MKKFFSLMLAVLLLVSALPFQAFATEVESADFWIQLNAGAEGLGSKQFTMPADADCDDAVAYARADAEFGAFFAQYGDYTVQQTTPNAFQIVFAGAASEPEVPSEPEAPVDPCANGHDFGEWTVTKEATCAANGVQTRVCENNAEHKETKAIPATGEHNFENGVCSVCKEKEGYGLKFNYRNSDGNWTSSVATVTVGGYIKFPEVPSVSGKKHTGWVDANGKSVNTWTQWYIGMSTEFTATYVESTDDDLVELTVYAYYYVDGEYHHKAKLFTQEFDESKNNNMVPWIYSNGISAVKSALAAEHGADGYQWNPTVFYNCYGDGKISEWSSLVADGNKSVYVKVNSVKEIEATVLLHIHTKQEYAVARTVKMAGYTAGDFVSYNDALTAVKKYYTGSKLEMSDLYDEGDWDDLMDGMKSSGSKTIKVEDNGTTEIHVIVKNASSKTNSNADSSNPKTGDYITIAVGTMVMAAAALVTLTELKKRKMI